MVEVVEVVHKDGDHLLKSRAAASIAPALCTGTQRYRAT